MYKSAGATLHLRIVLTPVKLFDKIVGGILNESF